MELLENFIYLNQSELSNFFMYIIDTIITTIIITISMITIIIIIIMIIFKTWLFVDMEFSL